jgi:hypothetical protein
MAKLLEVLTGRRFHLARSGSQRGRDMSSALRHHCVVAVECKRFFKKTELDERHLLGESVQAAHDIPYLDLSVLVASLLGHEGVDARRIYTTPSQQDLQRDVE